MALGCVGNSDCVALTVASIGAPPCLLRPGARCSSSHPNSCIKRVQRRQERGRFDLFYLHCCDPLLEFEVAGPMVDCCFDVIAPTVARCRVGFLSSSVTACLKAPPLSQAAAAFRDAYRRTRIAFAYAPFNAFACSSASCSNSGASPFPKPVHHIGMRAVHEPERRRLARPEELVISNSEGKELRSLKR